MTDWKFTKRGEACAQCQRPFAEGEAHVSSLTVEGDSIARIDACSACWKARDASSDLFFWRTRHSANKPRGLALNLEALEGLFVSLETRAETSLREMRYVLCLILMRKRRLKIERVARTDHGEALVVSRPRRRDTYEVDVFDFSPEQIDELRTRLQDVFEQADVDVPSDVPSDAASDATGRADSSGGVPDGTSSDAAEVEADAESASRAESAPSG